MSRSIIVLVAGLVFSLFAGPAAALTPEEKCRAGKLKAAAKLYAGLVLCHAKAVAEPAPDAKCLDKARTKFEMRYAKADAKGPCAGSVGEDMAAIENCAAETISANDDCLEEGETFEPTGTFTLETCVEALSSEASTRCCSGQLNPGHGFDYSSDEMVCRGYCG